jgi:hypothetical protein
MPSPSKHIKSRNPARCRQSASKQEQQGLAWRAGRRRDVVRRPSPGMRLIPQALRPGCNQTVSPAQAKARSRPEQRSRDRLKKRELGRRRVSRETARRGKRSSRGMTRFTRIAAPGFKTVRLFASLRQQAQLCRLATQAAGGGFGGEGMNPDAPDVVILLGFTKR